MSRKQFVYAKAKKVEARGGELQSRRYKVISCCLKYLRPLSSMMTTLREYLVENWLFTFEYVGVSESNCDRKMRIGMASSLTGQPSMTSILPMVSESRLCVLKENKAPH